MTREQAEELVTDLLDACFDYEHAAVAHSRQTRKAYYEKKEEAVIAALVAHTTGHET